MSIYDELDVDPADRDKWIVIYWRYHVRYAMDFGHPSPEDAYRAAEFMAEDGGCYIEGVLWPDGEVDEHFDHPNNRLTDMKIVAPQTTADAVGVLDEAVK